MRTKTEEKLSRRITLVITITITIIAAALPTGAMATTSCFAFFESQPPGTTGHCADANFFGFDGSTTSDSLGAAHGPLSANFQAITMFPKDNVPEFFDPVAEPMFADVQLRFVGDSDSLTEFSIAHRERVAMFPLSSDPGPGVGDQSRFIAVGSESKVVFEAIGPGDDPIPLEIEMEQDVEFDDPLDNAASGELLAFFLMELKDLGELDDAADDELIEGTAGSATFDSIDDAEPDFDDPFADGYIGFATSEAMGPGQHRVRFRRTISAMVDQDEALQIETLESLSIIADGFDPGDVSAWRMDSGNTFVFRVTSPDPNVRFKLRLAEQPPAALQLPKLGITRTSESMVRLDWEAVASQSYRILFATDVGLPLAQWQPMGTVAGASGPVTRDFTIATRRGFFLLEVSE